MKFLERFLNEHPAVSVALAALIAAIIEAITGIVNATGGAVPTP